MQQTGHTLCVWVLDVFGRAKCFKILFAVLAIPKS